MTKAIESLTASEQATFRDAIAAKQFYRFKPPGGLSIIGVTQAAPNASGSGGYISQASASTYREICKMFHAANNVVLPFLQSYSLGTGSNLNAQLGTSQTTPIIMQSSIEKSSGDPLVTTAPWIPAKVGGNWQFTMNGDTVKYTDPISQFVESGEIWYVRTWLDTGASNRVATGFMFGGPSIADGRPITGVGSTSGNATIGNGSSSSANQSLSTRGYGPLCVLGESTDVGIAPSFVILADSIGSGSGDGLNYNVSPVRFSNGFAGRAGEYAATPWVNIAVGGTKLSDWSQLKNIYQRDEMISYAPGVVVQLGTNDLGSSTATMQANLLTILSRIFSRYQNALICNIAPKATSSDYYVTYGNQSFTAAAEYQRRNWNRWLNDSTAAGAIANETPQGLVNSSNTSFWTQYGFSGTPTVTVDGAGQAVTVVDAAGGNFTITAPTTGTSVIVSYTKIQGAQPQFTALAPLGADQWKIWDIAGAIERNSVGTAVSWVGSLNYDPTPTSAGYWPLANQLSGSYTWYSGTITTAGNYFDSAQSDQTQKYAGCVLRITSGANSGATITVFCHGTTGGVPTYLSTSGGNTASIGDTYTIYQPPTADGTHPLPWVHDLIAQSAATQGDLIEWVSTPN